MNRIKTALGATFVAASVMASGAFAADDSKADKATKTNKADATQVVPSRDDLKPGAAPTVRDMDANTQRQHDPNSAAAKAGRDEMKPDATPTARGTGETTNLGRAGAQPAAAATATSAADVRDWAAIDKNNDNLISPEEMEEALKAPAPQAAKPRS